MTKYDMALQFAEILSVPSDHLVRVDQIDESVAVNRPKDCQLDIGRLKELGINTQSVDFKDWWRRRLGAFRH
jgi:S-adenosylmethionine synthetase